MLGRWHSVDPHTEKYESISSYTYCFNNPIRFFDIGGKDPGDIVVLFTGADLGQGMTKSTLLIAEGVRTHLNGGTSIVYSSVYPLNMDNGTQNAYDEILKNFKHDPKGRILLYGYSYGGVLVNHLAKRLDRAGIKIDIMVTVDAANGWGSDDVDRNVSNNVQVNENYFEENQGLSTGDFTLSHGAANRGSAKTKITNHNKSNDKFNGNKVNHMSIDDATVTEITQKLTGILASMKDGDKVNLNRDEIKTLFKH